MCAVADEDANRQVQAAGGDDRRTAATGGGARARSRPAELTALHARPAPSGPQEAHVRIWLAFDLSCLIFPLLKIYSVSHVVKLSDNQDIGIIFMAIQSLELLLGVDRSGIEKS